jgi:hypothetical protein
MSVNLIAEQTAANGGAMLPPWPASVSSSATFSLASKLAAASAKNGTTAPMAARRRQSRARAVSRTAKAGECEEQAVGEDVAVVEQ